eukprot:363986-Chlamydomonas_euryale.AAC.13
MFSGMRARATGAHPSPPSCPQIWLTPETAAAHTVRCDVVPVPHVVPLMSYACRKTIVCDFALSIAVNAPQKSHQPALRPTWRPPLLSTRRAGAHPDVSAAHERRPHVARREDVCRHPQVPGRERRAARRADAHRDCAGACGRAGRGKEIALACELAGGWKLDGWMDEWTNGC